ncbi:LOW QUALITY PROTEIN: protein Shroom4 [Triplophysa dalaica]|uniref:LOW QUALITY PROTEIN: protein Shroom4 n=1 Tax=Triplophysa dalaica TaxID=1582913 RepID=UPI0024DFCBE9|nr:LOW QUALITY PROTEIN: protein Shroom4 [Triplophysa dalaica]
MDGVECTEVIMETVEQLVSFQHIHVQLNGGAPWGFTLKGGLEHGEPLIITKIEEGGKAAQCKKLRVGDELVNINGSALYGSRQEALVLIKGSYRILKIIVRRRTVPLIRPHSWHLAKLSEAPCTTGTSDNSDGTPAMQLHLTPFSVPWHSGGENSELSMQWGHISRHYSTDRSSSIGSMESLENPPHQGYYDSQLSPIDPVIFNNKRDSAYSSFSASSNTSDYTVPVKPEETNSMDNLLQGLGSSSRYPDRGQHSAAGNLQEECESLKSKILSQRPKAKVRPSSYGCEEQRGAPPQPPMRRDSFRATRSQSGVEDKRCVSAPVGIPSLDSCVVEDKPPIQEVLTGDVYLNGKQDREQGSRLEPYYTFNSQRKSGRASEKKHSEDQSESIENTSLERNIDKDIATQVQPAMHRHSAPEKLLAPHLRVMNLSSDKSDRSTSSTCQWSQSPLYLNEIGPDTAQGKWGASRCSTPGSLATSEPEDPRLDEERLDCGQNAWPQSENRTGNRFSEHAVRVDTHPDETRRGEAQADDGEVTKQSSKRQFRNSKSRRRNERFATNLRNEIQRQKAQLQKSRNSGGCGEETVEEEVSDLQTEAVVPLEKIENQQRTQTFTSPDPPTASVQTSKPTPLQVPVHDTTHAEEHSRSSPASYQTSQTQTQIFEHNSQACVHVVEESTLAGKPRRWRWTLERKLQPETPLVNQQPTESKNKEATGQMSYGKNGTLRGRTSSSSGRLGRSDESDIPPFADRRRFFEETSRKLSQSVTNLSGLTSRNQRPDKQRQNHPSSPEPLESGPTNLGRRRFSYQGVVQDGPYIHSLDTSRQIMRVKNDQDVMREVLMEREEKLREKEEKGREQERIKEQEKLQEQAREMERLSREREKEQKILQEWDERQRLLQREKEWESERDTVQSEESISSKTISHGSSHDVCRKQTSGPQVPSSHQLSEHYYGNTATNVQKHCSAFQPVIGQHNPYDGYHGNPAYKSRTYTPTEVHPVREQEQTKLNRKFSLTERDYRYRTAEGAVVPAYAGRSSHRVERAEEHPALFSPLRNRAMSENDIRVETQHPNPIPNTNVSRMRASTLGDLDENRVGIGEVKKKKGPPPPRPPPPKWEQFHKRRASHHNLFTSPPLYSSPSSSPPRPQQCPPYPPSVPEMTRQRSYSLPPRDVAENHHCCCQEYSVAPPSPALTHRTFKPVALSPRERDVSPQNYDTRREYIQPSTQAEPCTRIPAHTSVMPKHEPRSTLVKPIFHEHQADWDRCHPHPVATQTATRSLEVPEKSSSAGPVSPESYFSMNNYHQQAGFSGAAPKLHNIYSHSPSGAGDRNFPIETDIDEIGENERAGEVNTRETDGKIEMQGFARPVIVLETDLDNMLTEEAPSTRITRGHLVDSILDEEYGVSRKHLIGDLFPQSAETEMSGESWRGGYPMSGGTLERPSRLLTTTTQVPRSTCYTLPENSQFLARMREISERKVEEEEELNYKKQLMESLYKKLGVLREAQRGLQEDIRANAQLGEEVESLVLAICKPNEVDKYRMFIGDLDKVTSLLLSLSGRLLRVESALDCVDPETGHHERLQLLEKKKQLLGQMGEAQELKEHVDRREQAVGQVLGRCLTPEQMRDYGHFVKMKAALLVEQRQLEDKIRLGEEQLRGLRESLGLGYSHY